MPFLGLGYSPPTARRLAIENMRFAQANMAARSVPWKTTMLGLGDSPPSAITQLVQRDRIELAKLRAETTPWKSVMRGLGSMMDELSGLVGLGAVTPARGTRAWWQWYATVYLPQYYNQQQIQQYVAASPYYSLFGSPFGGYGYTPGYYPQSYQQPYNQYAYNNPYQYQQYGYPYNYQPGYQYYYGDQGPSQCQAQNGYWDYGQNACYQTGYNQTQFNPTTQPPNVVGMPEGAAIAALNSAGFNVWEINVDGQSRGAPPGYSQNRVDISVQNGVVTAAAVG